MDTDKMKQELNTAFETLRHHQQYINRAVNSHEELLTAAKDALNVLNAPVHMHIQTALREAIAKAEAII